MNEESIQQAGRSTTEPSTARRRWAGAVCAIPCWILLAVAASLRPCEGGLGTHEQLGLPGCAWLAEKGTPCPSCGLTTSMSAMAHGRLRLAVQAQPFGVALFAATALLAMAGTMQAVTGRPWLRPLRLGPLWVLAAGAGLLAGWAWKLWTWTG